MIKIADLDIDFRFPAMDDLPFIYDTWVESFRLSHAAGPIPMDMYRTLYREIIRRVITQPTAMCLVAYNVHIPRQICGYVVFERGEVPTIHYCFVKHWMRGHGMAKALLATALIDPRKPFLYTFKSRVMTDLKNAWSGGRFDPIDIRKRLSQSKESE